MSTPAWFTSLDLPGSNLIRNLTDYPTINNTHSDHKLLYSRVEELYCFQYRAKSDLPRQAGWTFFHLGAEFARQGVPDRSWAACGLNSSYQLCPTYPAELLVPATATPDLVRGSAK